MIIFKYPVKRGFTQIKNLKYAKVLDVGFQDNEMFAWIMHYDLAGEDTVTVNVVWTGEAFCDLGQHVSSFTHDSLVYHAFQQ